MDSHRNGRVPSKRGGKKFLQHFNMLGSNVLDNHLIDNNSVRSDLLTPLIHLYFKMYVLPTVFQEFKSVSTCL